MARSFSSAWLAGDPAALALLGPGVRSPMLRAQVVASAATRRISPALVAAIHAQGAVLPPSAARRRNLDRLARGGAAAIVTGQQAGLFLGPLFTFYKAASAIALARALEAETGVPCVPVFWLQTEDHDFVEINHCWVPTAAGPRKLGLPDDAARMSVSHRVLGAAIDEPLAALEELLRGLPQGHRFMQHVRDAYRAGHTMSSSFAHLLASCFADEGLVLLEPRDPAVGALTMPVLHRAILEHDPIERLLDERSRALFAAGLAEQVPLRAGSPLAFFHLDAVEGPRHRLERHGDSFRVLGTERTISVAEALTAAPLRLSSSALLRPIVQDALLPTAAYVGGPGELAYFAQLAPLYAHFGLTQPAFALRARVRLLDATTRSLLGRAGLAASDVEQPREALLAKTARSETQAPEVLRAQLLGGFQQALAALEATPELDANLRNPIARTRETVEHAVGKLVDRYARSRVERDHVAVERVDRLQGLLYPEGVPQERLFGLPTFAAQHGLPALKQAVLAAIRPYELDIVDVPL